MKRPAEIIIGPFQLLLIDVEQPRQFKAGEKIQVLGKGLNFDALAAEVFAGYFRLAVPTHTACHRELACASKDFMVVRMVHILLMSSDNSGMAN
jgi:hypothetical protein